MPNSTPLIKIKGQNFFSVWTITMNNKLISIVLVVLMLTYVWMKTRSDVHVQIDNLKIIHDGKTNEEDEIVKQHYIFQIVSWEAGLIGYKLFIMAFIILIPLFIISKLFPLFKNYTKDKYGNELDLLGQKKDTSMSETVISFVNPVFFKLHRNVRDKDLNLGNLINIVKLFSMDLFISFLITILSFIIVFVYDYFIIPPEESLNKQALHMHADIVMFLILISNLYMLYIIYNRITQ